MQTKLWQYSEQTINFDIHTKFCYHRYYHFWIGIFIDDWCVHHLYMHNPERSLYSLVHLPANKARNDWWASPWKRSLCVGGYPDAT